MFSHKPTIVLFVSDVISQKMCSNDQFYFLWQNGIGVKCSCNNRKKNKKTPYINTFVSPVKMSQKSRK